MLRENLPAVPDDAEAESAVLTGEIVDDVPQRPVIVLRPVVQVVNVVLVVVKHEHAKTTARHVSYIPLGAFIVGRRMWESRSTARYDRAVKAAEQTGDHKVALDWDQRRAEFVRARHDRRMQRAESRRATARTAPWFALGAIFVLFALGVLLAVARRNAADIAEPVEVVAHVTEIIAAVIAVAWGPLVIATPWLLGAILWHVGRKNAGMAGPSWLRTALPGDDMPIDETTIAKALEALRIPQITDYLTKQRLPLQYIVPCRVDGRGTHAQLRLPRGVTAEQIGRKRAQLATGLYRSATEVWPATGTEAGILDLWVADKGALAEGAGPYPLLAEGFTDVFRGLPFGKTLRGEPARIPVIGRNTICGGMPEQGKSNGARVVACGYALDIRTELRIYVPDLNYDFEPFGPRCSRYVMGAEDEQIEMILADLEDLKDELQRRGQLLVDCGQQEVTQQVADRVPGLHPVFFLLEEAHVAIQHPRYGKDISGLLTDVVRLDRKRGVHVFVSTQAPVRGSMPPDVTRNCTNGVAFAVGDLYANDALLGQGAYSAGHRATDLIPGTGRGTALVKGFSGQRSEVVQVHQIDVKRDKDDVTPIVQRALAALRADGRPVPGTLARPRPVVQRDLLTDLGEVLRGHTSKVRVADLPAMLRRLAPSWGPYHDLTGVQLRELLEGQGVRTTNTGNVRELDPAELARAELGF